MPAGAPVAANMDAFALARRAPKYASKATQDGCVGRLHHLGC